MIRKPSGLIQNHRQNPSSTKENLDDNIGELTRLLHQAAKSNLVTDHDDSNSMKLEGSSKCLDKKVVATLLPSSDGHRRSSFADIFSGRTRLKSADTIGDLPHTDPSAVKRRPVKTHDYKPWPGPGLTGFVRWGAAKGIGVMILLHESFSHCDI
ncbi:unnamed protein product [Victoria cruziana]